MSELATAYVQIVPSAKGIKGNLTKELSGASSAAATASGGAFAGKFAGTAVKALGALGIAASLGGVLTKGWNRMTSIDSAKAKLTALGNSAKDVKQISEDANASVKGTAFGMDSAMTSAASAVAAGIKPGEELTRYLSLMGDAASVAGISMDEMGSIFNKVAANGKVSTEEMNQLADRGIPIWQLLAKETGMSMTELRNAVTKGEIDINDFQNAIEKGMGGAAKTIGSTTIQGALSNIGASISRMGANLLGSADDADSFAGKLLPMMNNLMGFMGKIESGASVLGSLIGSILGPIMDGVGQVLTEIGKSTGSLAPLKTILQDIGNFVGQAIVTIMPVVIAYVRFTIQGIHRLMKVLSFLAPVIRLIFRLALKLLGIISTFATKGIKTISRVVSSISQKLSFRGLVAKVSRIWKNVKDKMTEPIRKAKEKIIEIINKIKNKFPVDIGKIFKNMKTPYFKIETESKDFGKLGSVKWPSGFTVGWHAKGGIVNNAQLIGAGEAGSEAILPLDPFWKRMDNMAATLTAQNGSGGGVLNLVLTIGDEVIGQTAVNYINGQTIQFGASPLNV